MRLIPKVNGNLVEETGTLNIENKLSISQNYATDKTVKLFKDRVEKRVDIDVIESENALISLTKDDTLDKSKYILNINENGISIKFSTDEGLNYGLTTLYHLIVEAVLINDNKLTYLSIEDSPLYNHRGLSVDTARHFFPIEELKKIVEQMSLVKLNVFHWHIVDDQGFRLESKVYPELTKLAGNDYYKQEEIKDFIEFASVRGIEVVPEIDIPGHTTGIIYAYPNLSCTGEQPVINEETRVYKDVLCGGKEEVYEFLENLLNEVAELFPANRVHLGGDEVPKYRWSSCPHCKAKLEEIGLESFEDLQGHILNFAKDVLKKHNKTVVCWNDALKANNLDEEINIQYWLDPTTESYSIPKINKGRKVVFSEVFSTYLDYSHNLIPLQKTYEYAPIIRGISFEEFDGVLGLEVCVWSERIYTAEDLQRQVFPRAIAIAEASWTKEKNYQEFVERLEYYYEELDFGGIAGKTPLTDVGCFDENRVQKALADLGGIMQGAGNNEQMGVEQEEMQEIMNSFINGFFTPEEVPAVMQIIAQLMG